MLLFLIDGFLLNGFGGMSIVLVCVSGAEWLHPAD